MNYTRSTLFLAVMMVALVAFGGVDRAMGSIAVGKTAPRFNLPDIQGRQQKLDQQNGFPMTVLFFFDAGSQASQEGLLMLGDLHNHYADKQLTIWGISRSPDSEVSAFARKAQLRFPILLDQGEVSKQYGAGFILPVVYVLGPDLTVTDYFQGGGKSAEAMLVSLAQSQLHRDQPQLAEAIGKAVTREKPENLEARAIQGYAALKLGQADKAEKVFTSMAQGHGKADIIAQEGQAAVLAFQGKTEKALALADAVTRKAPKRGLAHKIKGDLLASKGDLKAAATAYEQAVKQSDNDMIHKAEALNQLGRLYSRQGEYALARSKFDQAVDLDPYYLEPTSNKGVTYEKEGLWSKALQEYRKALKLNQADAIASVLAQNAQKILALQKDAAGKERMDRLVKDLVKRYKQQKATGVEHAQDEWTSRPMVMTFLDLQESGGLASRDGLGIVLETRIGELLNDSGRVQVVERAVMEQLLSELNLGSSELADPNTALKLGKVLAAKLIGTGSLIYLPDSTLVNLRLIDTETSAIAKTITLRLPAGVDLEREMFEINRTILKSVMTKYPLQGYIVKVEGDQVMLNLGSRQGVSSGSGFQVIEEGQSVTYKGKVLHSSPKSVGRLEVVKVEPDFCMAHIVGQGRKLSTDDMVQEVLTNVVSKEAGHAD
jgi:tetratricopeptide (TPR) repeat protein